MFNKPVNTYSSVLYYVLFKSIISLVALYSLNALKQDGISIPLGHSVTQYLQAVQGIEKFFLNKTFASSIAFSSSSEKPSLLLSATIAEAPSSIALEANVWPSTVKPQTHTKREPGITFLESNSTNQENG